MEQSGVRFPLGESTAWCLAPTATPRAPVAAGLRVQPRGASLKLVLPPPAGRADVTCPVTGLQASAPATAPEKRSI